MNRNRGRWIAVWAILVVVTGFLAFGLGMHGIGAGPWGGWGHMGAPRNDAGTGYGSWPGMMGWGMHGGMMMGAPGMPGIDAANRGVWLPGALPDLTSQQREQVETLQRDMAQRVSELARQQRDAYARLNTLYAQAPPDWDAIRTVGRSIIDLQRQQQEAVLDLQQKIHGLLTDAQREAWAHTWRAN